MQHGELYDDVFAPMAIVTMTRARTDFIAARGDAITLLRIHDQATGGRSGRPKQELAALKRSSLILAVTAWESFVEDTISDQLDAKLVAAASPDIVSSVFNAVAHEWADPARSGTRKPPEYRSWTGDGWKNLIADSLKRHLEVFHTPSSENVRLMFKRYLSVDPTLSWSWQAVSSEKAQKQLDTLIRARGAAVHRGRALHPNSPVIPDVDRSSVVKALNLVYNLAHFTEVALGVAPTERKP